MGKKHLQASIIPKSVSEDKQTKFINKDAAFQEILENEGNTSKVFLSLKYTQNGFQCFSDWTKQEMNEFWNFNSLLHGYTWQDVYSTSRKKNKTGLAYTEIPIKKYPNSEFKNKLSPDITLFELRVNQKIRVHGFRVNSIFFLCWLDRNHDITD